MAAALVCWMSSARRLAYRIRLLSLLFRLLMIVMTDESSVTMMTMTMTMMLVMLVMR